MPATTTYRIAVLPGDGIGRDVTDAAVAVLKAATRHWTGTQLEFREYQAGAAEYLRSGCDLPEATLAACRESDAVLLGAMGLPDVRKADGRELTPQIELREILDLYCGLRPIQLFHSADTPLKGRDAGEIDFVIVRENTEGLFFARHEQRPATDFEARDTLRITRAGSERVFRSAFRLARRRRRHVTLVDKANVLPSMVFFRKVFDEVAAEFPEVTTDRMYVDAAALHLVRRPESFDVLVTENMFGDILSDLAAALVGGMGMAPSADIGDEAAVFQPSHGTAPDIAGKGIANPIATILSAALMLEWLECPECIAAAARIRGAVTAVLSDPACRTPDLSGRMKTEGLTAEIVERLDISGERSGGGV
ncbi:MAG: isocitrate/isopropylmalate dehydrogenase family protein [Planctomycetaceae bacterium]|nr:isocitrate/isopropylmalate dehydrogenase family protein [Planctomycetaceae bacterium]